MTAAAATTVDCGGGSGGVEGGSDWLCKKWILAPGPLMQRQHALA